MILGLFKNSFALCIVPRSISWNLNTKSYIQRALIYRGMFYFSSSQCFSSLSWSPSYILSSFPWATVSRNGLGGRGLGFPLFIWFLAPVVPHQRWAPVPGISAGAGSRGRGLAGAGQRLGFSAERGGPTHPRLAAANWACRCCGRSCQIWMLLGCLHL
jgi:hypothetical protein